MIRTEFMTPCTSFLGLMGGIALLACIVVGGVSVGVPHWVSLATGHVGLFQACRDGMTDCYNIDQVYKGTALDLAKLGLILGVSGFTCLVLAAVFYIVYACITTIDHGKIMLGVAGIVFTFIGSALFAATIGLRIHLEFNASVMAQEGQTFSQLFAWGFYLAAWTALGSVFSATLFIFHLFMAVYI